MKEDKRKTVLIVVALFFGLCISPSIIGIDDTPPLIANVQATPDVQKTTEPLNITCTVTDNWDLVDTVKVHVDGPEGFTMEAIMDANGSSYWYEDTYATTGFYRYYIWANDTSNNIAISDTYSFAIVALPPTMSYVNPLPTWITAVPFTVTATAFNDIASVTLWYRYSSDGADWTDWTFYGTDTEEPWSWEFTGSDGYYEFYSIAIDDYENVEDPPNVADATTGIDTVPPVTTIEFGEPYYKDLEENIYITSDTPIYLNAMDNESGVNTTYYRINEGKWGRYTDPFSIPEDCEHAIYFYSVDNASNEESIKNKNVSVDNYPPYPVIPPPDGNNGWHISSVIITFADAKSGAIYVQYKIDGGSWQTYCEPIHITGDGWYTIDYYAIDIVGNEGTGSFSIKIDQTPPTTTHEFKGIVGDNDWYASDVTIILYAEDETSGVDYTMYKIDDGEWITYTTPFNVCGDGMHTLCYYSVDVAGNVEDVKGPFVFKIDQTDPTIWLTTEKIYPNTWLLMADVDDETSGVAKVEFYVNGEFVGEVREAPYEWIYNHRFSVRGLILNPEFTEETVSFFAVIAIGHSIFNNPVAQAIVFDNAGNEAVSPIPTSLTSINYHFYIFKQLTFSNNYSGYIGKHFIFAVFE